MKGIRKLLFLTLFVSANFSFAQLSGTAFLGNQSNHAGIKVKFKANPGTAVTDSALTNAGGNYYINIASGSYNISFSKPGFITEYYNNNTAVILTNSVLLSAVTLTPGNYMTISGTVSGTLLNTYTYIATAALYLAPFTTLVIQPGTVIEFAAYDPFDVYGTLLAEGTPNNKILFTTNKPNPTTKEWIGLNIYNGTSKISNCIVEHAYHCINAENCAPTIEYNEVRNFWYYGINMFNGDGVIRYNVAHDFSGNSMGFGIGASCNCSNQPTIECNEVYNGAAYYDGIVSGYSSIVKNNYCHDMVTNGIRTGWTDSSKVYNNVVGNCGVGIDIMGDARVANNTVFGNITGISLDGPQCTTRALVNNLVVNNNNGILQSSAPTPSVLTNNLLWNNNTNYAGVTLAGVGQTLTVNSNGDPVDAYNNFSVDPNFVSGIPPYLNSSSHCYNAGDTQYSPNVGCNTSLICSNIIIEEVKEFESDLEFAIFPNPFSEHVIVKVRANNPSFIIKDVLGKNVDLTIQGISNGEYKLNTSGMTSGIYFLTVTDGTSTKAVKLIKN